VYRWFIGDGGGLVPPESVKVDKKVVVTIVKQQDEPYKIRAVGSPDKSPDAKYKE